MIRSGNLPVIRVIASILNLYRAMDAKHPKFSTASITAPHPILEENPTWALYQKFTSEVFPKLLSSQFGSGKLPEYKYETALGTLIRSAGANLSGPSSASATIDAQAWKAAPENHVLRWFELHEDHLAVQILDAMSIEGITTDSDSVVNSTGIGPRIVDQRGVTANGLLMATRITPAGRDGPILSRLHTIDEPAGKVRVVAICDYWTQVALKPVHEWLFSLLKGLVRNDATFDQDGVVNEYFNRGLCPHWSFDLKTATDSIPLALYKAVLYPLLQAEGESPDVVRERVDLWAKILTDRDFYLPVEKGSESNAPLQKVRYGTGQPMGALSSWASMALVHHSLVQFSHWRATQHEEWYKDYLILGDDVDISSSQVVSDAYKETCADFSITIGLAKSLQSSKNCFEFANRRYIPEGDISPLSFREELACSTWTQRLEFAKRILRRFGIPTTEVSALLRRAVTSAQWIVLTPEMSGRRPSSVLRLVRYCLLNPLQNKSELEELNISSVLDWITNVMSEEDRGRMAAIKVDTVLSTNLSRRIVEHLRKKILEEFQHRLDGEALFHWMHSENPGEELDALPLEFSSAPPLGQNAPLANLISGRVGQLPRVPDCARTTIDKGLAIIDDMLLAYRESDLALSFNPPLSPVSWQYFRWSVWETNRGILSNLLREWDRFDDMVKRLPPMSDRMYERDISTQPQFELYPLGEWIKLWIDVVSLPKEVKLDVTRSVNYNLDYNSYRDYLNQKLKLPGTKPVINPETIFGPLQELATVVAEFAGATIPNLPFFGDAKKGNNWYKSLTRSLKKFQAWERSDALVQEGEVMFHRLTRKPRFGSLARVFIEQATEPSLVDSVEGISSSSGILD
jgi:hypothetical protein